MDQYRLLEHTADTGVELEAASLAGLLRQAALSFPELVDYEPVGPQSHRRSMILADSVEELLVNWYNEFIFLLEQGQVVTDARIRTCSDTKLDAELQCAPVLPGRPLREVKAATWHQLEVNGTEGNWRARIYLDL